jgi:hypothetical protein
LMLGYASVQQTQRQPNVTDQELRKGLEFQAACDGPKEIWPVRTHQQAAIER